MAKYPRILGQVFYNHLQPHPYSRDNYQAHRFHIRHQFGRPTDGSHERIHGGHMQEVGSLCQPEPEKRRDGTPHRTRLSCLSQKKTGKAPSYKELRMLAFLNGLELFRSYPALSEIYLCGGCIRDYLMGRAPGKDLDVFVHCNRTELDTLLRYLARYGHLDYGPYGSPRFYPEGMDTHYVDIVPFYNFIVSGEQMTDILTLLSHFDFTANALGYNLKTGEFYDPVGGMKDIQSRTLKAVRLDFPEKTVSPSIPLSAVSVFWFRLLHYQHKLDFRFDRQTEQWILANAWRYPRDIAAFEKYFFKPILSPRMSHLLKTGR